MNRAKMEKLKKIQNLKDFGMSNQELVSYVINPIKIEKIEKKEINEVINKYNDKLSTYNSLGKYSIDKKEKININTIEPPKEILDLWNNRSNNPYKQILHFLNIEDYTKRDYKKENDLIIHKTTQLDKLIDVKILKKELKKLEKLLYNHDKELKAIYSDDRQKKFMEKFEYENKHKNRIKYDPKNCSELKETYKKEQKKINKQNKQRTEDLIELLLACDDLSQDDINEIKKIQEIEDTKNEDYEKTSEIIDKNENKRYNDLEKELEKEIQKELGKYEYKQIMKELENIESSDSDDNILIDGNNNKNYKDKYKNRDPNVNVYNNNISNKKIKIIKKNENQENNNGNDNKNNNNNNNNNNDNNNNKNIIGTLSKIKLDKYKNR
jgi:hypothetical protein